jgi:cell filamentation protein
MTRYKTPLGREGEYEQGSHNRVLRNKLGIKRKTDMDHIEFEALVAAQRHYYTKVVHANTAISAEFIRKMHRYWLGEIYEWAGKYRTVELKKDGFPWPPAHLISENMLNFENTILAAHTPCKKNALEEACKSIAIVHAELLLIHPFREGNGRLARWLADIMAMQAGFPIPAYRFEGRASRKVREDYLLSVVKGYAQDYEDLARFFERAIRLREIL